MESTCMNPPWFNSGISLCQTTLVCRLPCVLVCFSFRVKLNLETVNSAQRALITAYSLFDCTCSLFSAEGGGEPTLGGAHYAGCFLPMPRGRWAKRERCFECGGKGCAAGPGGWPCEVWMMRGQRFTSTKCKSDRSTASVRSRLVNVVVREGNAYFPGKFIVLQVEM